VLFVSAMFNDDDEDAMDAAAAAVFATGDVTKADAVPTATRRAVARVVDVITFIIMGRSIVLSRRAVGLIDTSWFVVLFEELKKNLSRMNYLRTLCSLSIEPRGGF